jgi:hypothetical protein
MGRTEPRFYKLIGRLPVLCSSMEEWVQWSVSEGGTQKRVASTLIEGEVWVSTVFLGLDHNWLDDEHPHLFETMVFEPSGEAGYQTRCSTWQEAEEMHAKAVELMKAWIAKQAEL